MKTRIAVAFLLLVVVSLCFSQQITEVSKTKVGHIYVYVYNDPFDPHTYYNLVISTKLNDEGVWYVKYLWLDANNKDKDRYIGTKSEPDNYFLLLNNHIGKATALDSIAFRLIK